MTRAFPPRYLLSLTILVVAALTVAGLAQAALPAIVTLVLGSVAVFAACWDEDRTQPIPPPPEPAGIDAAALVDAVVEPILVLRDGRILHANTAARALLGGHVVGEDVRTAIRHPAAADRLAQDPSGSAPIDLVGLGTAAQRWEMHVATLPSGERVVHLVDRTGSDATERMRVDFVANASHELRTPLASILGYVETLDDAAGDDPTLRRRFLHIVLEEARRMQRLVEDLMSLSRIEAEKYRAPATPVDLGLLVGEVRREIADGHGARGRDLVLDLVDDLPPVLADPGQMSQLVHNLVGNAIKYGAPDTPVTITLARDGTRTLRLSVADRGDGIAPEHLPRLTERFYRVDAGRSRSLGGTGLGLAIVKHIVERHRGRLDIASTVGEGTRVTVTLPVGDVIKA